MNLDAIPAGTQLVIGHHDINTGQACAMDAIAWAATGEITDMPACVHPILARKVHQINDDWATSEADRWMLVRECGPLLVGSDVWAAVRACWVVSRAGLMAAGLWAALVQSESLAGAYLAGANLTGAHLTRAHLTGANLTGATANARTTWPTGYNPTDHGVTIHP